MNSQVLTCGLDTAKPRDTFTQHQVPLSDEAGSFCKLDNACVSATGDVALKALDPRGSGDAGDVGDVGSLSLKLPLTLSILNDK